MRTSLITGILVVLFALAATRGLGDPAGAALDGTRIDQETIAEGWWSHQRLRLEGLRIFTTPFNRHDGYGDGPPDAFEGPAGLVPGTRPTLQGNGTFLRANGLDGQTCLECHSLVSARTVPPTLGIGGVGGSVTNAIIMPTSIDPADLEDDDGVAGFTGRFANPPFLFGAGGVELLGLEMTMDLQALAARARQAPGEWVDLLTKGVSFGRIRATGSGALDTADVVGVDDDLIVRPFGRKGQFATVRAFDIDAMQFHFGMQPTEAVGDGVDPDGDGVFDEIRPGDLSALHVFGVTLERPAMARLSRQARRGRATFDRIDCTHCHKPQLDTQRRRLPLRFPEVDAQPLENVFYRVDLTRSPTRFRRNARGGVRVPLFADLKRHDMGPDLAEDFHAASDRVNREFTTARLWGVADTAPYLHDGRATTLEDAILMHGGEAQDMRDAFAALSQGDREDIVAFLRSLRTPRDPAADLLRVLRGRRGRFEDRDH